MPRYRLIAIAAVAFSGLAGCNSANQQQAVASENRAGQTSVTATSGGVPAAALGLTETQLLEADLTAADGSHLGDVEQVRRNASGTVDGLLVELERSDTDRYVLIPIDGLTPSRNGDDIDLQTNMSAGELAAMPDAIR